MKYLVSLFFLLFAHNIYATTLCDDSCELIITFPDGGSIIAVNTLTISFGEGGYIDDGAVTTGYAAGEMIVLAAADTVLFNNEGVFNLGTGGNIEYTAMEFNSTGGASLTATGGTESIFIEDVTFSGGINITLNASVVSVTGTLSTESGSVMIMVADTGGVTPSFCSVQDAAATLTISTVTIDTTDTCNTIVANSGLIVGQTTVLSIDPNITLTSVATITPTNTLSTIDVGDLTVTLEESEGSGGNGATGWFLCMFVSCVVCCRKKIRMN